MNNASSERLNKIRYETFAETSRGANASVEVNASLLVAVLDELLALREAGKEPVAYISAGKLFWSLTDDSNKGQSDVIHLYAAPQLPAKAESCLWSSNDEGVWEGQCGLEWQFFDGDSSPQDNGAKFCPRCGLLIAAAPKPEASSE